MRRIVGQAGTLRLFVLRVRGVLLNAQQDTIAAIGRPNGLVGSVVLLPNWVVLGGGQQAVHLVFADGGRAQLGHILVNIRFIL